MTLAFVSGPAAAQYELDLSRGAEIGPHIRYFGSTKDDRGRRIVDVSLVLDSAMASFVVLSDGSGRFSSALPLNMRPKLVTPRCVRPGYRMVRVTKRPGSFRGQDFVQIDCVMRRID